MQQAHQTYGKVKFGGKGLPRGVLLLSPSLNYGASRALIDFVFSALCNLVVGVAELLGCLYLKQKLLRELGDLEKGNVL